MIFLTPANSSEVASPQLPISINWGFAEDCRCSGQISTSKEAFVHDKDLVRLERGGANKLVSQLMAILGNIYTNRDISNSCEFANLKDKLSERDSVLKLREINQELHAANQKPRSCSQKVWKLEDSLEFEKERFWNGAAQLQAPGPQN
jgi:hypothetical protein